MAPTTTDIPLMTIPGRPMVFLPTVGQTDGLSDGSRN
jgi:hypothetical protein